MIIKDCQGDKFQESRIIGYGLIIVFRDNRIGLGGTGAYRKLAFTPSQPFLDATNTGHNKMVMEPDSGRGSQDRTEKARRWRRILRPNEINLVLH